MVMLWSCLDAAAVDAVVLGVDDKAEVEVDQLVNGDDGEKETRLDRIQKSDRRTCSDEYDPIDEMLNEVHAQEVWYQRRVSLVQPVEKHEWEWQPSDAHDELKDEGGWDERLDAGVVIRVVVQSVVFVYMDQIFILREIIGPHPEGHGKGHKAEHAVGEADQSDNKGSLADTGESTATIEAGHFEGLCSFGSLGKLRSNRGSFHAPDPNNNYEHNAESQGKKKQNF